VRRCPFLAQLAKEHGEDFATSISIAPTKPVGREPLPTGTDAVCGLAESFRLFHGPQGLLPLTKGSPKSSTSNGSRAGCPYHALAQEASSSVADTPTRAPTRAAPFATISLSNFGKGVSDFASDDQLQHCNCLHVPMHSQHRLVLVLLLHSLL